MFLLKMPSFQLALVGLKKRQKNPLTYASENQCETTYCEMVDETWVKVTS